ncbi:MAG: AMP-binding protein [Planctomycetota bacterium]|nr:AMP-binding protein [Planctomycetota bacterium]
MNLGDILIQASSNHPQEYALLSGQRKWTFAEVHAAARSLAERIRETAQRSPGTPPSTERVALLVPNCPAFSVAYFATLLASRVVVPINPLLSDNEIRSILLDCRPDLMIFHDRFEERLPSFQDLDFLSFDRVTDLEAFPLEGLKEPTLDPEKPLPAGFDDTAVVLYTSGSTGDPKGVELTHQNLLSNAMRVSRDKFSTANQRQVLGPGQVSLAALPLSHAFGQTNLQNGTWYSGGAIAYCDRFDAEAVVEQFCTDAITFFAGVPTMYVDLIEAGRRRGPIRTKLRFCVCGGAALAPGMKAEFREIFGVPIQESYGLTETSPMISCQRVNETDKSGCVGRAIEGMELRIVDDRGRPLSAGLEGEIEVRGENVFKGYLGQEELNREAFVDGWFKTGDVGYLDHENELWIVDRKKEMIKRGGYPVYPREIERVILQAEGIVEVVVLGVPDNRFGEQIKALVNLRHGEVPIDPGKAVARIRKLCQKKLAAYKQPAIIEVVKSLPRGSTGKLDRRQLKETHSSQTMEDVS